MEITIETEVTTSELAAIIGLTGRRIRQLAEDGVLERVGPGRFNLADSLQRYIAGLTSKAKTTAGDADLERAKNAAEAKLKHYKAKIVQLEAEELEGKMHRSEDVEAAISGLIYSVRGALLALPGRLAVDAADADTAEDVAGLIHGEVLKILKELSQHRYDPHVYEERVRERRNWDILDIQDDD